MTGYEEPVPSGSESRSTRGMLSWIELCGSVRGLVAQANREAGETVLCDDLTDPATELVIYLLDGHGFKLQFEAEQNRVMCNFPLSPQFNRTLELSANAETKKGKAVWTDRRTGLPASHDELAGDLVRNLLIMTSDTV